MKEIAGQDRDFQHADERAVLQSIWIYDPDGRPLVTSWAPRLKALPTVISSAPTKVLIPRPTTAKSTSRRMRSLTVKNGCAPKRADVVGGHVGDEVLDAVQPAIASRTSPIVSVRACIPCHSLDWGD
jgi:hypothetical protein